MRLYLCFVLLSLPGSFCQFENSTELIEGYGLPAEEHEVVTEDGYIITIFRVAKPGARVFLLDPGLPLTSDVYLVLGRNLSLSCILYDAGYDVWLANHRGSRYGKQSVENSHPYFFSSRFWDYSMDEVASYDESAIIDYILNVTQQQQLNYAGHSAGPAEFLALLSSKPEYNDKVRSAFLMAPALFPSQQYHDTWLDFALVHLDTITDILRFFHVYEAIPRGPILHFLTSLCIPYPDVCRSFVEPFLGSDWTMSSVYFPLQITHFAYGTTSLDHIRQVGDFIKPGGNSFTKFDYGTKINKEKYGTENPPAYDLSKVKVPIYAFSSAHDSVVDPYSVRTLSNRVRSFKTTYVLPISKKFGHLDFVYGTKAKINVYEHIIGLCKIRNY